MVTDDSKKDEWFPLSQYPNYEINKNGQLRNRRTNRIIKNQYYANGIAYCTISDVYDKQDSPHIDRLVMEIFAPNPNPLMYDTIVHVDGDNRNCSLNNLIWAKNDEAQRNYQLETGTTKPKEYFEFFPLAEFPDSVYEINKVGQIRHKQTQKLLKAHVRDSGYLAYTLYIQKKIYYRYAHVLVAKQFIPNPDNKAIVNHIDENKLNPCVDNLEWVTHTENARHGTAQERGSIRKQKPINEYTVEGEYIRTWKSIQSLAAFFDLLFNIDSCKGNIERVVRFNTRSNIEKKVLFNRIFIRYDGKTENIVIKVSSAPLRGYKNYITPVNIAVPSNYLYSKEEIVENHLKTLFSLLNQDKRLSHSERKAIQYAIQCIKELNEPV